MDNRSVEYFYDHAILSLWHNNIKYNSRPIVHAIIVVLNIVANIIRCTVGWFNIDKNFIYCNNFATSYLITWIFCVTVFWTYRSMKRKQASLKIYRWIKKLIGLGLRVLFEIARDSGLSAKYVQSSKGCFDCFQPMFRLFSTDVSIVFITSDLKSDIYWRGNVTAYN